MIPGFVDLITPLFYWKTILYKSFYLSVNFLLSVYVYPIIALIF